MPARIHRPDVLKYRGLLTSQVKQIIEEANLGYPDTEIAEDYFLKRLTLNEIAEEFEYNDHSAISRRLDLIIDRMKITAKKLNMIDDNGCI